MSADYLKGIKISILYMESDLILMITLSGGYYWSFYRSGNGPKERTEVALGRDGTVRKDDSQHLKPKLRNCLRSL